MLTKSITIRSVYFPLLMLCEKRRGMSHLTKCCQMYERHLLVHGRNEKSTSASKFYDILMTLLWYAENEVCPKSTAACISGRRFGEWDPQLWDDEIKTILFVSALMWRKRIACWKGRAQCSLDMGLSVLLLFSMSLELLAILFPSVVCYWAFISQGSLAVLLRSVSPFWSRGHSHDIIQRSCTLHFVSFFWSQVVRAVFKSLAFLTESFSFHSPDVSRRLQDICSVRVLFLVSFVPAVAAVRRVRNGKRKQKVGSTIWTSGRLSSWTCCLCAVFRSCIAFGF